MLPDFNDLSWFIALTLLKFTLCIVNVQHVSRANNLEEHLIELKGLSPFLMGRISLSQSGEFYNIEVDIIQSESGKIFNHVTILYNEPDKKEALNLGVHHLQKFLDSKASRVQ